MQGSSKVSDQMNVKADSGLQVESVEVRLIRLPLIEPFETSFGKIDSRLIFLVSLKANGYTGWARSLPLKNRAIATKRLALPFM